MQVSINELLSCHDLVSCETKRRLESFCNLLLKWQRGINLIGNSTISDVWNRHILDSAQLIKHVSEAEIKSGGRLLDIGSGGGFPGVVLAIMLPCEWKVTLVESDQRKAAFLREALRITETKAQVVNSRIERVTPILADVITARAVAPLERLLQWSHQHVKKNAISLFLKGKNYTKEVSDARAAGWQFSCDVAQSITDSNGVVLKVSDIAKG